MTDLDERFNWGSTLAQDNPDLYRQLNDTYTNTAQAVNRKGNVHRNSEKPFSDPPADSLFNKNFNIGDIYVREDNDTAFIMTSRTSAEAVTWTQIT